MLHLIMLLCFISFFLINVFHVPLPHIALISSLLHMVLFCTTFPMVSIPFSILLYSHSLCFIGLLRYFVVLCFILLYFMLFEPPSEYQHKCSTESDRLFAFHYFVLLCFIVLYFAWYCFFSCHFALYYFTSCY